MQIMSKFFHNHQNFLTDHQWFVDYQLATDVLNNLLMEL